VFTVVGVRAGFRWLISFLAFIDTLMLMSIGPSDKNKVGFAAIDTHLRLANKPTKTSQRRKKLKQQGGMS